MILATVITNLVMALMIREANVALDNDGAFCISSVKTQYIHSVTLHPLDSMCGGRCKMCDKPIMLTPIDYLGVVPKAIYFDRDKLRQKEYHIGCDPWVYIDTNVWFRVEKQWEALLQ